MRKYFILFLLIILVSASQACALSEKDHDMKAHDCAKCHVLKVEDASAILKDVFPNAKVISVGQAPVKGLWEVYLQSGNAKGIIYIDYSKKNFFSGAIVDIKAKKNLTQERAMELNKIDVSKIPLDDAIVMGDKNAQYKVIVFDDPDCPYCKKLHEEIKKVLAKRKDIAFMIKFFPLPMHGEDAYRKSKIMICEKSAKLLDDNFEGKPIPQQECKTKALEDDAKKILENNSKLASEFGITGTPALIMPDGRLIPGYRPADELIEMITKK